MNSKEALKVMDVNKDTLEDVAQMEQQLSLAVAVCEGKKYANLTGVTRYINNAKRIAARIKLKFVDVSEIVVAMKEKVDSLVDMFETFELSPRGNLSSTLRMQMLKIIMCSIA